MGSDNVFGLEVAASTPHPRPLSPRRGEGGQRIGCERFNIHRWEYIRTGMFAQCLNLKR
jgi:hypothetical protein